MKSDFPLIVFLFCPKTMTNAKLWEEMWKLHYRRTHWIGIDQKQAAKKRRINLVLESKKKPSSWEIYSSSTLVMNWQLNCLEVYKTVENQTDYIFKQWEQGISISRVEEVSRRVSGGKTVLADDIWLRYSRDTNVYIRYFKVSKSNRQCSIKYKQDMNIEQSLFWPYCEKWICL